MSSVVYNLTAVGTAPSGAVCTTISTLDGSVPTAQGNIPAGIYQFTPVSDIALATTSRSATFYGNVTLAETAGSPPAQITAVVTYYGPPPGNPNGNYISIATGTITASATRATASAPVSGSTSTTASSTGSSTVSSTGSSTDSTSNTSSTSTAAESSTTPIPPNSTSVSSNKGYSAGAVAGAAVGCAIGGILIGCLVAFFILRRRRRDGLQRSSLTEKREAPSNSHGEAIYLGAGSKGAWTSHLPQPESDGTIRSGASRTLDQIEMHIENFYVDKQPAHLSVDMQSAIEDFDSPNLSGSVLNLLPTTDRPTLLLKHCLTNLILSRIDTETSAPSSFLPRYLTSLQTSSAKRSQPGFTQALSQWRVLSSYLRQPADNDRLYLAERDQAITTAAKSFCQAFEPWARSDESTRLQSLISIMKRASDVGVLIASQPSTFHWQWDLAGTSAKKKGVVQIVVLPGLYKLTDQEAAHLSPPVHLTEPRIEPLSTINEFNNANLSHRELHQSTR